jgi:hypothetical protein
MRSWEGGEGRSRASAGVDEEMEEVEERKFGLSRREKCCDGEG